MPKNNLPIHKIAIYPLKAAIWEQSGKNGTFYNVTVERTYKDDNGDYQSSTSFNRDDLLPLAKILDAAHTWIITKEEEEYQKSQQGGRR